MHKEDCVRIFRQLDLPGWVFRDPELSCSAPGQPRRICEATLPYSSHRIHYHTREFARDRKCP